MGFAVSRLHVLSFSYISLISKVSEQQENAEVLEKTCFGYKNKGCLETKHLKNVGIAETHDALMWESDFLYL